MYIWCGFSPPKVIMKLPIAKSVYDSLLEQMDILDISAATIRQSGAIAKALETQSQTEFLHLEMGIPGLPPMRVGIEAEKQALDSGVASQYPNMYGIPKLKEQASRFLKAYLDIDVAPLGCIPTVGSMQGSFSTFLLCSHLMPGKDTILFINPGFPVQRTQVNILNIKSDSFDIYEYRGEKLHDKLESYLKKGNIAALIYSSPNNPAWFNLTEEELRTIGEAATRHDAIVIEDLAYMCMDFRKPLGRPFEAPFQPTVAKYTDNYIIMMSASKMFSYAGQRIAVLGDMLELGVCSRAEHYKVGRIAAERADVLLAYGKSSDRMLNGAITGGMAEGCVFAFTDHETLAAALKRAAKPGDILLFKGSRGMHMEISLEYFLK